MHSVSRRAFLGTAGLSAAPAAPARRPRVACILNVWFPNSHADVFVTRLIDGYRLDHAWHAPRLDTVSFYVDAIAIIGEHGEYPRTPRGNVMYPRARYFDEIARVLGEEGRALPVYQDKYFAYEWADARRMYDTARRLRLPLLCGSTVPQAWQRPPLDAPRGSRFEEILGTSFSDLEEHAYHGIEMLQAVAERRQGGETGVARVRYALGDEVWSLAASGEWSRALLDAALRRNVNHVPPGGKQPPEVILIRYRDGLKSALLHVNAMTRDYNLAARIAGRAEPAASCFYIQLYVHNHWSIMVRNFEDMVLTGREPNPPERTLMTNGILLAGLESRRQGGKWIDTPELSFSYS